MVNPEATYSFKTVKHHKDVANSVVKVDDAIKLVSQYALDFICHSDDVFSYETIEKLRVQEDGTVINTDGAYDSEKKESWKYYSINIITTDTKGCSLHNNHQPRNQNVTLANSLIGYKLSYYEEYDTY